MFLQAGTVLTEKPCNENNVALRVFLPFLRDLGILRELVGMVGGRLGSAEFGTVCSPGVSEGRSALRCLLM